MWYDREHENTSLHSTFDRKRTQPSPAGIRARRTSPSSSQPIGLPQANGAQHHPRLQYEGAGGVARRILASPSTPNDLPRRGIRRSEEHTSELQSQSNLVCRLLLEK